MSERCIVRVKFTPAGGASEVRRAVGGFLRYVQHRDLHPDSPIGRPAPEVSGLLKYVAYRDKASSRAELFGPDGAVGTAERKAIAEFVARSIEQSEPQLFRTRDGRLMDRRRAVSRFVISPETAQGLDLDRLTRAAVARLESEMGVTGLRWIAAIHRNTRHHHIHLVVAGMHEASPDKYHRVDVSKARLAAIKQAVGLEIECQRGERIGARGVQPVVSDPSVKDSIQPTPRVAIGRRGLIPSLPTALLERIRVASGRSRATRRSTASVGGSVLALRAAARRYQRQMARDAAEEARRLGREWAA